MQVVKDLSHLCLIISWRTQETFAVMLKGGMNTGVMSQVQSRLILQCFQIGWVIPTIGHGMNVTREYHSWAQKQMNATIQHYFFAYTKFPCDHTSCYQDYTKVQRFEFMFLLTPIMWRQQLTNEWWVTAMSDGWWAMINERWVMSIGWGGMGYVSWVISDLHVGALPQWMECSSEKNALAV